LPWEDLHATYPTRYAEGQNVADLGNVANETRRRSSPRVTGTEQSGRSCKMHETPGEIGKFQAPLPLESVETRTSIARMGSSVYLKLRDGRVVPLLSGADERAALAMKGHLDSWMASGHTLSVANAHGQVDDITPRSVRAIEIVEEPSSGSAGSNVE
jgi:hypothetical protein